MFLDVYGSLFFSFFKLLFFKYYFIFIIVIYCVVVVIGNRILCWVVEKEEFRMEEVLLRGCFLFLYIDDIDYYVRMFRGFYGV